MISLISSSVLFVHVLSGYQHPYWHLSTLHVQPSILTLVYSTCAAFNKTGFRDSYIVFVCSKPLLPLVTWSVRVAQPQAINIHKIYSSNNHKGRQEMSWKQVKVSGKSVTKWCLILPNFLGQYPHPSRRGHPPSHSPPLMAALAPNLIFRNAIDPPLYVQTDGMAMDAIHSWMIPSWQKELLVFGIQEQLLHREILFKDGATLLELGAREPQRFRDKSNTF